MADIAALEAAESSYAGAAGGSSSSAAPRGARAAQGQDGEGSVPPGQKRKMRITCMFIHLNHPSIRPRDRNRESVPEWSADARARADGQITDIWRS